MLLVCKCHAVSPMTNQHKHVFEEHVASLCTWSLGTSHTHTENSCNIFNGQWKSIERFPALSVTLVSNWVLTKECNWKSKKRKQAHKYRCLRSGWMWMKFPETSIFDELVRREKFQLLWTATTLLVKQLSIHGFQQQDVLKRTYVQLIWPRRCCFVFKEICRVYEVSR